MRCTHTIAGMLAIVGLGYFAGIGHSLVRKKPVILGPALVTPPAPTDDTPDTQPDPSAEDAELNATDSDFDPKLDAPVPDGMLSLRQAYQMWNDGAYFIDSRHKSEYDEGHVEGAAHLTAETFFTDEGDAQMQTIPPDAPVVIYCLGGDECEASKNTMALLQQSFYTDLHIMGVGYDEWADADLPTASTEDETGDTP
jgi:rhodanese-related sulfurtransferase